MARRGDGIYQRDRTWILMAGCIVEGGRAAKLGWSVPAGGGGRA
jgi:hypothetical protein